jgi:hypothetical protein
LAASPPPQARSEHHGQDHRRACLPQLAEQAADAIRGLDHRTRGRHAFVDPAELDRLLAALTAMANGVPQLNQLDHWLRAQHDAAQLCSDTATPPDELICLATGRLGHGRRSAHHLSAALDSAHQHVAHLAAATPTHDP